MNTFFKYVQPSIVKTSDDIQLREDLRNLYMVNFNVFGIDYFEDTYLLREDESGNAFYIVPEDDSVDNNEESSNEESNEESSNDNSTENNSSDDIFYSNLVDHEETIVTFLDGNTHSYDISDEFSFDKICVDNYIGDKDTYIEANYNYTQEDIVFIEIGTKVLSICSKSFANCSSLVSVKLPNTIVFIGTRAFANCINLASVNIPNNINTISQYTFDNCENLNSINSPINSGLVNLPHSIINIETGAFSGCKSITTFIIPDEVTSIGEFAFSAGSPLIHNKVMYSGEAIGKPWGAKEVVPNNIIVDEPAEDYISGEDETPNDAFHIDLESSNTENVIDLPRIYIQITTNFITDSTRIFQKFVCAAIENPVLFAEGIDGFKPGVDYFINKTLFDYLFQNGMIELDNPLAIILPNYLASENDVVYVTKYWVDRTGAEDEDYTNLNYFYNKNLVANTYTFGEDELKSLCSTFCGVILDNTIIPDNIRAELNNQIYDIVLNYWRNYGSDDASTAINLILNSLYSTSTKTSCGCSNPLSDGTNDYTTTSCYDLYKQAMQAYLNQMLADAQFYKDWMYACETPSEMLVNTGLVDLLIILLEEFISMGWDLSFTAASNNCSCPVVDTSASECNYKILNNYLKVLNWVKNKQIDANVNKIKVFGTQFAELLPKLQF